MGHELSTILEAAAADIGQFNHDQISYRSGGVGTQGSLMIPLTKRSNNAVRSPIINS